MTENITLIGSFSTEEDSCGTIPTESVTAENTIISGAHSDLHHDSRQFGEAFENRVVGKYQIRKVLGRGGMGVVYRAFDPLIEREVALKVLSPEISQSPVALQRFLSEARSIGRLSHPNVVSIFEISEWNGIHYLVMEFLAGGSAADLAERMGPLPWRMACRIAAQAARGLAAAHHAGLIHRDIKPANLMLSEAGDVKVVDFGLSKLQDSMGNPAEAVTQAGQLLGTPHYMSPEQFDGVSVDARTDVYALGATLYRLLTDRFPFQDSQSVIQLMKAHLVAPVPQASLTIRAVPQVCDRIISRAMAKEPSERYQSCLEMAEELESLLAHSVSTETKAADGTAEIRQSFSRQDFSRQGSKHYSALIVEPSRMQAAMRRELLQHAGIQTIESCESIAEAQSRISLAVPDLVWTAMELPDGRAVEWLRMLGKERKLQRSTVVVNCSDCTVEELKGISNTRTLVLAPKIAGIDAVLSVLHGSGPIRLSLKPEASIENTAPDMIRLISDTGRIPQALETLCHLVRGKGVQISASGISGVRNRSHPVLTMLVRHADTLPGDESVWSAMVSVRRLELAAAVQVRSGQLYLRSAGNNGTISLLNEPLHADSLQYLLEAGRFLLSANEESPTLVRV